MENLFDGELGYPIYGPLPNTELATLDSCNGRRSAAGGYQHATPACLSYKHVFFLMTGARPAGISTPPVFLFEDVFFL